MKSKKYHSSSYVYKQYTKAWVFKCEYVDDEGREWYYDYAGNLTSRLDESKGYRDNELTPEIRAAIDRARKKDRCLKKSQVDYVIDMMQESPLKALRYVQYRFLGECTYADVFGSAALAQYEAEKHYATTEDLSDTVNVMAAQMEEMQRMIFNILKVLNAAEGRGRKVV